MPVDRSAPHASGEMSTQAVATALTVFAVAPQVLGGVRLRAPAGPQRDAWLQALQALLPAAMPWRRLPASISDEALLGSLDLAATLAAGRPVAQAGLLAQTQGGVLVAAMAERMGPALACRVAKALDDASSSLAIVALDEGADEEESAPASLLDRLALQVHPARDSEAGDASPAVNRGRSSRTLATVGASHAALASELAAVQHARACWRQVTVEEALIEALVAAAASLGIHSLRAACHAVTVARIAAALDHRLQATTEDAALAARLVLAPRATQRPAPPESNEPNEPNDSPEPGADSEPPPQSAESPPQSAEPPTSETAPEPTTPQAPASLDDTASDEGTAQREPQALDEQLVQAALAALPPGLLAMMANDRAAGPRRGEAGRAGQATRSQQRGRSIGAVRGEPRGGARLALIDTLRAAAPWQRVRHAAALQLASASASAAAHASASASASAPASTPTPTFAAAPAPAPASPSALALAAQDESFPVPAQRVFVTRDDLRIQRRVQRRATTTIFAIDASGSQALHRLAEAKGAVELLLADCYARRDRVAVIGFRGAGAQLLLAPTRSLVRAKRQLSGLPGGGGTPLAAGLDATTALAAAVRRGGATPLVVLLTDGRANIARGGTPGRAQAMADALLAARAFATAGTAALLIDTSAQPSPAAHTLANAMRARCVALPHAGAHSLSAAVRLQRNNTPNRTTHIPGHG